MKYGYNEYRETRRIYQGGALCSRIRLLCAFLAIWIAGSVWMPVRAAENGELQTVTVAVEDSGIFVTVDQSGNPISGYVYEYIENIAAYANWDVEYVFCGSFSDCLEAIKAGRVDLYYDVSYTEERTDWLCYPDQPMGTEEFYLFCLSDNKEIHSDDLSTLNGRKAGVTAGTIEAEELQQWCQYHEIQMDIIEYESDPAKAAAFEAGEIDLEYEISMLAKNNYSALTKISGSDFYLVAAKDRGELIRDINEAYKKIEGVNRYFLEHLNEKYYSKAVLNLTLSADETAWVEAHDKLRVGYMDDYMPFCNTEADGTANGIVKDIVPLLIRNIGLEEDLTVEYRGFSDCDQLYAALKNGEIDTVFPIMDNIEFCTRNQLLTTLPVISLSADLACSGGYSEKTTASIAVDRHNRLQDFYSKSFFPDAEIRYFDSAEACLKAVTEGEAGCVVLNGLRTSKLLSGKAGEELTALRLVNSLSYSFAVGEGNSALLSLLNRSIVSMEDGFALNFAFRYAAADETDAYASFISEHKVLFLMITIAVLTSILVAAVIVGFIMMRNKRRLADANAAKTRFLFNMSHDIRTPMNAILGFTDMARKNIGDPVKLSDYLDKAQQAGNLLLSLINSVLEMSRIESGKAELDEKAGSVLYSFSDIESTMQELAEKKNIDLKFEYGEVTDRFVYVDIDRANRVFINLISNAIKYTDNGGRVRVRCEQSGKQGACGLYRYTVEDNGIGMSEEFQKVLFDEFSRESSSTVSGVQGSGLGLSVAKAFVELMNGTITCTSRQGMGTTFVVTLPLRLQKREEAATYIDPITRSKVNVLPADEASAKPTLAGKRILLVEDNEMNREIAADILDSKKVIVEEADDGTTAVEMLKEKGANYYDAILMDIQMPIMNGYDATRAIRAMYPDAKLPIIALSANAFAEDKAASLASGMNDHIAKPINTTELLQSLTRYL